MRDPHEWAPILAHRDEIRLRLGGLSGAHQIACAAWCCERLYAWYDALLIVCPTIAKSNLRIIVDRIWRQTWFAEITAAAVDVLQATCESIDIGPEGCSFLRQGAMSAVDAVWVALEAIRGEPSENASKCFDCVFDVTSAEILTQVFQFLDRPIEPSDYAKVEQEIFWHPNTQNEIRRQNALLEYLENTSTINEHDVRVLRSSAV